MKKLFFMLAAAAVAFTTACENTNENGGGGDTPTPEPEEVTLELLVDNNAINLDNKEVATFTVMYGEEDVTAEADIINITDGDFEILSEPTFTTLRPGEHTFYATYGDKTSENIIIEALTDSDFTTTYYRRNLFMKFTATSCTYCPAMTDCLGQVQKAYPNRVVEMAIHSGDALSIPSCNDYVGSFGIDGLPTGLIDFNGDFKTSSRSATQFINWSKESLAMNPTVTGIKMSVEAEGTSKLKITSEITVAADGNYKVIVPVLQSGFNLPQNGTNDVNYTQDHVLRAMLQKNVYGDMLNEDGSVTGEVFEGYWEANLTDLTQEDIDQMNVLVIVLNEYKPGVYYVNNVQECKIGESKDYEFERYEE